MKRVLDHALGTASQTMDRAANEAPDTRRKTTWIIAVVALVIVAGAVLVYVVRTG